MIRSTNKMEKKRALLTDVGRGTTILEVPVPLGTDMSGDTDRGTTVGNTARERANVARLVPARQTEVVVLAVNGDVVIVPLRELLNSSLDRLHASGLTHLLGRIVGVASGTVPVALERLRVEGDLDIPLLGNAYKEVAGHPEVVAHGDTLARADLELPLRGHDLGINTGDVDACVEASAVVRLDEVTGKDLAGT